MSTRFANKNHLSHRVKMVLASPTRVPAYLRRSWRHRRLQRRAKSQTAYYAAWVDEVAESNPDAAVGTADREAWKALGRYQAAYLRTHGLARHHQLLDIGCGNLRGGRHLIAYLEPGCYVGVDISEKILSAARTVIEKDSLQAKRPRLLLICDNRFALLPDKSFDVVHAHSVFSHCEARVIDQCLFHVRRLMRRDAFFDFTFLESAAGSFQQFREDYYYRREDIFRLLERHGFRYEVRDDWDHVQVKIRATRTDADR